MDKNPETPIPTTPGEIRREILRLDEESPIDALLLVGDGAVSRMEADGIVPAPRVSGPVIARFGDENHIASDSWYADLDDDGFQECSVGRLPVRTSAELDGVVRKIIRYETQIPTGLWQRDLKFIAGVGGFSPLLDRVIDRTVRNTLAETIPAGYALSFMQADWKSVYCPDPQLFRYLTLDQINAGSLFWVYMGHGSIQSLDRFRTPKGDLMIFERDDVRYLDCRGGPPILVFCACYTGAYDAREESLAEEAFLTPNGPVAVIASSRTAMPYGMTVFGVEMMEEAFRGNHQNLGQILLAAKRGMRLLETVGNAATDEAKIETDEVPNERSDVDTRRERIRRRLDETAKIFDPTGRELDQQLADHRNLFNLFGDPLLAVRIPKTFDVEAPETARASQTVHVSGAIPFGTFRTAAWSPDASKEEPWRVLVELSLPANRKAVRIAPRREFSLDDKERVEYQNTFEAANRPTVSSATCETLDGTFVLDLTIPNDLVGHYVLRAAVMNRQSVWIGSRGLTIRPSESSTAASNEVSGGESAADRRQAFGAENPDSAEKSEENRPEPLFEEELF